MYPREALRTPIENARARIVELLRAIGLSCHYGARTIFEDLDAVLRAGERVALVGPNGAGKSSLLRQLTGIVAPETGSVVRARGTSLGYLAQGVADETNVTLQQLVDAALARIADADWAFARKRLNAMLVAFGFSDDDRARSLESFSGGQRSKAALAHLLIDAPDILVLDEPTNHLDISTVRWLEDFIVSDARTYVIVSHDRYFLDRIATNIWELDLGELYTYRAEKPAYTRFTVRREERLEAQREAYRLYLEERDKRRATIAGLRATHTSSDYAQVRSRERLLERLERDGGPPPPPSHARGISLRIDASRRATTGFAFEAKGLAKAYDRNLFSSVTFDLQQHDRLAIVGPNGAGKSTLLRILAEDLAADAGIVRYNPAVRRAYFAQNIADQLDPSSSAVDAVMHLGKCDDHTARSLLGRLRISGAMADRAVSSFSGGERRRVALAGLMAQSPDVLLLDEPTNDLDIASREALEDVLEEFPGAVVAVSHDRYFLNRLVRRVLWIEDGDWGIAESYEAYEARERVVAQQPQAVRSEPAVSRVTPLKKKTLAQNRIMRAERAIEKLDARKAEIEMLFADPQTYEDRSSVTALQNEAAALEIKMASALSEWEAALADAESLT